MVRQRSGGPPRRLSILGATGSIGASTIDVLLSHPEAFEVELVTADRNAVALAEIARKVGARRAVVADASCLEALEGALSGSGIEALAGRDALIESAGAPVDLTVAAIVGAAGLAPTMAAIEAGSDIALANKECLVSAGALFVDAVANKGVKLLPLDSEHNAIFQVLEIDRLEKVEKIVLTASGGPFRTWPKDRLASVTPDQATDHPNWSMGRKISVDSSTMMNKGLELIEAKYLFGVEPSLLDVLVHPQSIIHGLVAYSDGSVLAQMSVPDMRVPVANCLWWPDRQTIPHQRLDLAAISELSFEHPDEGRFPCLMLARSALESGPSATNILNAANEIAVEAFLESRIGYTDIARIVEETLDRAAGMAIPPRPDTLADVYAIDAEGRRIAREQVALVRQRNSSAGLN